MITQQQCQQCSKKFIAARRDARFCGQQCYSRHRYEMRKQQESELDELLRAADARDQSEA